MYSMVMDPVLRADDCTCAPLKDNPEKASAVSGEAVNSATARTAAKDFIVLYKLETVSCDTLHSDT